MSQSEAAPAAYELRVDARGVRVTIRSRVSVDLFEEIVGAMVSDPRFERGMPAIWDVRDSDGFAELSPAELIRMVGISRRARSASPYRVAMVADRDVDFGVARMLRGTISDRAPLDLGVFRDVEKAERWAFDAGDA